MKMEVITTNCPRCNSPLELVVPDEVLQVIKEEAIVKFTCISCSAIFKIKLIFSTPKGYPKISDPEPKEFDPIGPHPQIPKFYPPGPRPQIRDIEDISKSNTIANIPDIFVRKLC